MKNTITYRNIKHAIVVLKMYKELFSESGKSSYFKLNKVEYKSNKTILLHFVKKDHVYCPIGVTHYNLMMGDERKMIRLNYKSAISGYPKE